MHLAVAQVLGEPAAGGEVLPGDRGVVKKLGPGLFAEVFVPVQSLAEEVPIGQVGDAAHPVHQYHLVELGVGIGVSNDGQKGRQARARGQQIQVAPGAQIGEHQRADGFFAQQHFVADTDVLQPRGQRPIGHFDAQKFEFVIVVCAGDAVGAQQRLAFDTQADHGEMPVFEAKLGRAFGLKTEQALVPVFDFGDANGADGCHCESFSFSTVQEWRILTVPRAKHKPPRGRRKERFLLTLFRPRQRVRGRGRARQRAASRRMRCF